VMIGIGPDGHPIALKAVAVGDGTYRLLVG
jgi:hypothetical protein